MKMLKKLKGVKNGEWILLLFAAGILLLYFSSGGAVQDNTAEGRLSSVLSGIEGAGKVEVFISYSEQQSSVYTFGSADSDNASGRQINGVVVVASGAGDTTVRLKLAEAVRVALGVDAASVSVYKMGSGEK